MFLVKCSSSLRKELILMKLYTVAVYYPRMCMNEEKTEAKYFKGDNL